MWFSVYLPVFVPVFGSGPWMGGGVGGVGGGGVGGTQHSEGGRGGGRWKSEQNNLAQWELRCGGATGVEGGAGVRAGITVVKETVICPRPGPYPQSSSRLRHSQ